jgi:hypothetical protein
MATTTNYGWTTPNDSDPFKDGALAIRTLGNAIDSTAANTWKGWTAYTPAFQNLTVGNGTSSFYYIQIGKTVHVRGRFILGSTSSFGTSVNIAMPVNISATYGFLQQLGYATYAKSSYFNGSLNLISDPYLRLFVWNVSGSFTLLGDNGPTTPFTWATGDQIIINATYEAA